MHCCSVYTNAASSVNWPRPFVGALFWAALHKLIWEDHLIAGVNYIDELNAVLFDNGQEDTRRSL
jgi:hypothetical protein